MRRKALAMLFVLALMIPIALTAIPVKAAPSTDIFYYEIDPEMGFVDDEVHVSGEVWPAGTYDLEIWWDYDEDDKVLLYEGETESDGTFDVVIEVPDDWMGEHTVDAFADGACASATFYLCPRITLCKNYGTCPTTVTIHGTGLWYMRGPPCRTIVKWWSPCWDTDHDGGSVKKGDVTDGRWSATFEVEDNDPGVYVIKFGPPHKCCCKDGDSILYDCPLEDGEEVVDGMVYVDGGYCHRIRVPCWCHPLEAKFYYGPVIVLDPDHGPVGTSVTVEGYGFTPSVTVALTLDGDPLSTTPSVIETNPGGYFTATFDVPAIPAGEHEVTAEDSEEVTASATFKVCPSISITPTSGYVGTEVTVEGTGFAYDADVTVWFSGLVPTKIPAECTCMDIPCDLVNPLFVWNGTDTWILASVGWFLPVAEGETYCDGTLESITFTVPDCWGGYHAIAVTDDDGNANIINMCDVWDQYDGCGCDCGCDCDDDDECESGWYIVPPDACPYFPDGLLVTARMPWECGEPVFSLVVNEQMFRVLPQIWTDPKCGVSGQIITLHGTGLSAFEMYIQYTDLDHNMKPDVLCMPKRCQPMRCHSQRCCKPEGNIYSYQRTSGFVLDFGPNENYIDGPFWPWWGWSYCPCDYYPSGHYVLNGQFDQSWYYGPMGGYAPLQLSPYGSLVSGGISQSLNMTIDLECLFESFGDDCPICDCFEISYDWEYQQMGCPYLTVPFLQPDDYCLLAYRFDYIEAEFYAEWPEEKIVDISLEFCTYDRSEQACTPFTIECLQVEDIGEECQECDLSGIEARLDALEGNLDALVEQLNALDAKITGLITNAEGNIIAEIETAVGTIQEDLSTLDAKIVKLDGDIATIGTAIGDIAVTLDELNAYVTVDLTNDIASIEIPDLGTIEGELVEMDDKIATIETDIGTITKKADLIVNHTGSMPVTIALSLIAAISAIAAAVLILRKVYIA